MTTASDLRKRWALRDSNPRPSPCKGGKNLQVTGLTCGSGVSSSVVSYRGVPSGCDVCVMQEAAQLTAASSSSALVVNSTLPIAS